MMDDFLFKKKFFSEFWQLFTAKKADLNSDGWT